jgi:hypothetical protein
MQVSDVNINSCVYVAYWFVRRLSLSTEKLNQTTNTGTSVESVIINIANELQEIQKFVD